jgi:acetyltransferase-like isoleucine patch superfamily enzyme
LTALQESNVRPNKWISLILWLLPNSSFKTWGLRRLGNHIGDNVKLGPSLVLGCGRFSLGDGAAITNFNSFRNLSSVELGPKAFIGNFNQFTAAPDYQLFSPLVGKFIAGELTIVTNRHYFDCSGQIILRPFAGIGGIRSIFQSHEIDLEDNQTKVGRVVLGENAMTCTACTLLKDSHLPDRSVLAAGSILTKSKDGASPPTSGLYAGAPARFIREVKEFDWWTRDSYNTPVTAFDDAKFRLD